MDERGGTGQAAGEGEPDPAAQPGSAAQPVLRIGDAERASAMTALDTHLEAGRLDAVEYGERSAKASVAATAADLDPSFADLPEPHPTRPGGRGGHDGPGPVDHGTRER